MDFMEKKPLKVIFYAILLFLMCVRFAKYSTTKMYDFTSMILSITLTGNTQ